MGVLIRPAAQLEELAEGALDLLGRDVVELGATVGFALMLGTRGVLIRPAAQLEELAEGTPLKLLSGELVKLGADVEYVLVEGVEVGVRDLWNVVRWG
ncbi:hypothetical protein Tdes44962_MAKER08981 [Teratosphaeria destructans]|uniref:Uncharacterized protein n=1 Tax=Teratosphaeria destructans TaxID=418781 RepID=A0A9W7W3I7_9PEZI|nr:hypothetical protein Tdes44962_MAKER08981 [Teratosphaeria destructans]